MLPPDAMLNDNLSFFEKIIVKNSLRLGCNLSCYLTRFDTAISILEKRKGIRKQLVQKIEEIKKLSEKQKKLLLTPGVLTQLPFVSLSLSHCAVAGGFIISPEIQYSIGLDLEQRGRAKEKTVFRISNQGELKLSPSPCALWSAKEAAYKSINQSQADTSIKQITISHWHSVASDREATQIYNYQFKTEGKKGKGYVCFLKDIVIAFSFVRH